MSQKYKSFSKGNGRTSDCGSGLPAGVKRMGYLRKLKKMQRRFFVLHMESNYGIARLEYFGSEKKWKLGCEPRRCIELKSCLNISHKPHPKYKRVISLYTEDDCFSVVTETEEDLELWLSDLLEVQKSFLEIDENSRGRSIYEHLWQVVIDKHDLENDRLSVGSYRVALSSKSLFLIKMNPVNENDYFEFPLMSIRRCGHSKDHFFIELGRSSVIGAGEIYMATEGTVIAQNMHETVLSAMKSSKIREDGISCPRPRSASTSENTNPVTSRRPIEIVAPQTVSLASCSGLSSSRERCDSLPTRPQTISGNPHSCLLGALSSPYASSGTTFRRLNSRPHSMYEWPSCKSPSTRNTIFSPSSISSTTACSSTEEVDSIKPPSVSLDLQNDGKLSSDPPITEVPDEYLMMSLQEASKKSVDRKVTEYMDMKSSISKSESLLKVETYNTKKTCNDRSTSGNTVEERGYLDMSPSNSLPKDSKISSTFKQDDNELTKEVVCLKSYELEKSASKVMPMVTVQDKDDTFTPSKILQDTSNIPVAEVDLSNSGSFSSSKPPIPKRMCGKGDCKSLMGPPLPDRSTEYKLKVAQLNSNPADCCNLTRNVSTEFENKQDLSQVTQNDNCQYEESDVFYCNSTTNLKTSVITSPDQNTNFSCLTSSLRSNTHSLPCASICSANKTFTDVKQSNAQYKMEQSKGSTDFLKNTSRYSNSKNVCDNSELPFSSKTSSLNRSKVKSHVSSNFSPSADKSYNFQVVKPEPSPNSVGDYVNIDFKKPCDMLAPLKSSSTLVTKPSSYLLPACSSTSDPSYSNIQFGKPICPTPKPVPASCDTALSAFNNLMHSEDGRAQKTVWSPTDPKSSLLAPKFRNIPNTLPAFRKQMSAPAGPLSLRPELPSPGRKSSCPVTASSSMVRTSAVPGTSSPMRPLLLQSHGGTALLSVSASKSPDHSSVSSVSSASDEVSSAHSSPKTLCAPQMLGRVSDAQYENVVIPHRLSSTSSRPSSTSSEEKELNYASLDLTPSTREEPPCSPTIQLKPPIPDNDETLTYAEIDFTKSEGLKNTSGIVRESRL